MGLESQLPVLTPEQQIVLAAVRVDHARDDLIRELLKGPIDWDVLIKEAAAQGVFPLVYRRLTEMGDELLPPKEAGKLKRLYLVNAQRNYAGAQRLIAVLRHLGSYGIDALPLKGPVVAVQAYGDLALRQGSADLDILVRRDHLLRTREALTQIGYSISPLEDKDQRRLRRLLESSFHWAFEDVSSHALLEVHWAIAYPWDLRLSIEAFWEHTQSLCLYEASVNIQVLSTEDTCLLLCIIGARDGWRSLRLLVDLAHLVSRLPLTDYQRLINKSKELYVHNIICFGLTLAQSALGADLIEVPDGQFLPTVEIRRLAERVELGFFKPSFALDESWTLSLELRDSIGQRIRRFMRPNPRDWAIVDLPDSLYPLYYLVRPIRLLLEYGLGRVRRSGA